MTPTPASIDQPPSPLAPLFARNRALPLPLVTRYPAQHLPVVVAGMLPPTRRAPIAATVARALAPHADACGAHAAPAGG